MKPRHRFEVLSKTVALFHGTKMCILNTHTLTDEILSIVKYWKITLWYDIIWDSIYSKYNMLREKYSFRLSDAEA